MWSVQWCSKKALADGPIDEAILDLVDLVLADANKSPLLTQRIPDSNVPNRFRCPNPFSSFGFHHFPPRCKRTRPSKMSTVPW